MKPTIASPDPLLSTTNASLPPDAARPVADAPAPGGTVADAPAPDGTVADAPAPGGTVAEDEETLRRETRETISALGTGLVDRSLVTVLQHVQERLGYLPRAAMLEVADQLSIPAAQVYGVATFYNQFRFNPPGRRRIKVCMGTACAIKQGGTILESWERRLDISEGETTADREYSLERVACVGCCSLAPVVVVNEEVRAHMTPTAVDGLLLQHQIEREKAAAAAAEAEAEAEADTETASDPNDASSPNRPATAKEPTQ